MYGKMKEHLAQTLSEIREAGLYKEERQEGESDGQQRQPYAEVKHGAEYGRKAYYHQRYTRRGLYPEPQTLHSALSASNVLARPLL